MGVYMHFCSIRADVPITGAMGEYLIRIAIEMVESFEAKRNLKTDQMEGQLTTTFGRAVIGTIAGVRFDAIIETEQGAGKIIFVLQDHLIPHIDWDKPLLHEIFDETLTPHPGENAHLN